MKCKKFITVLLCLAITPLFSLNVCASEGDDLQALLDTLNQNIEETQQISNAIDEEQSTDDIAEMLNNVEEIDLSALETADEAPTTGSLGNWGSSGSSSTALEFARLQLELANSVKNNAMDSMNGVRTQQEEQTLIAQYKQQVNDLKSQAETEPVPMPGELLYYMNEKGLPYPTPESGLYTASDCQQILYSLEDRAITVGSNTMDSMKSLQDFLSDYNSSLMDASSYLQGLTSGSPSLSRGQSLFSPESGTANVTPVAVSVLAGILVGMFLMWTIMKKKSNKTVKEESI